MAFKSSEVATLTVNGVDFRDWKTVLVHQGHMEAFNYYRFTCSEGSPLSKDRAELRIRPGDHCTVSLGGQLAISGFVTHRQVAYTANSHAIEIIGKTYTASTTNGAAVTKTGEFVQSSFKQVAENLLKPFGIKLETKGNIDNAPFDRVNVHGQTVWQVLETLARSRGIALGTDPKNGNVLVATGASYAEGGDSVVEGRNILEGHEILSMEIGGGPDMSIGQQASSDKVWGPEATRAFAEQASNIAKSFGVGGQYMPNVVPLEMPGGFGDVRGRAKFEMAHRGSEQAVLNIVVQGWFAQSGGLWRPLMFVHVKSPMLIMDESIQCKSVTFTQDDKSGTRTNLELVRYFGGPGGDLSGG